MVFENQISEQWRLGLGNAFRQLVAITVDVRTQVYYVWLSEELLSTSSEEFMKKALIIRLKSCWQQLKNIVLCDS